MRYKEQDLKPGGDAEKRWKEEYEKGEAVPKDGTRKPAMRTEDLQLITGSALLLLLPIVQRYIVGTTK